MKAKSIGLFAGIVATMAVLAPAHAQNITLGSVVANNGAPSFPSYTFTQNGSTGPGSMQPYNFSFNVNPGSGFNESYVGFCVNLFNADPVSGDTFSVDTTGSGLSYEVGSSGNYWATDTSIKFTALKNVLFANESFFSTTATNSQAYADMAAAFSILTNEIVLDYDGTPGSIDYLTGSNTVAGLTAGAVLDNYNTMLGQINTTSGSGFNLYAATWTGSGTEKQDMVFFAVPEPSIMGLASVAGLLALRRRRNAC